MSRGRKKNVVLNSSDWENVFYNSVGTYVQYINLELATEIAAEPLSKHIRIAGGYAFKSSDYKKQGVPVIRISDFSNEKIVLDDVVFYDESKELEKYELDEGDIVIALTGGTIAKLGIVQQGIGKLYLNQRVGKFEVLNPDEFESEYVYWIARSVQSIIKNLAWGAAIPNVSPKQIEELEFPIPDKETQKRIIAFLNALKSNNIEEEREYFNSKIESNIILLQTNQIAISELTSELIHQQDLVKQLRQSFLKEAMQGKIEKQNLKDGNAKDLLEKIKAEKTKFSKKEKPLSEIKEEEIPFEIPGNWVWCRLGDLTNEILGGFAFDSTRYSKAETNNQVIRLGNVKTDQLVLETSPIFIDDEYSSEASKSKLLEGDILITMTGTRAKRDYLFTLCISKDDFAKKNLFLNQRVGCFRFSKLLANDFLNMTLKERKLLEPVFLSATGAANQANIGITALKETLIPLPPLPEQNRIVKKLEELMKLCDELQASIQASKTENEKLLQGALRDALRKEPAET